MQSSSAIPRRIQPAAAASGVIRLRAHSTPAADPGTEMLSSSLMEIVSTSPAAIAATAGAPTANQSEGIGDTAGRVQRDSAMPAAAPPTMKATVPATVLS